MKRIGMLSVALAAGVTVACAGDTRDDANRPANDTAAVGTAGERGTMADAQISAGARDWLENMMTGSMAEVKLGEMASQRAQDADVKAFGQMIVRDHSNALDELKQIGSKYNVPEPVELPDEHRDTSERLSKLQGREFDQEYIDAMVDKHQKTINQLEDRLDKEGDDQNPRYTPKQTENAVDRQLNEWAAKTVPTVRQHLERARQLDDKLGRATTDR